MRTEKPYTPKGGNSGMQSDKASVPKTNLPRPPKPRPKRIK